MTFSWGAWLVLGGCSGSGGPSRPPGVAPEAVRVWVDDGRITVGAEGVVTIAELARAPTEPTAVPLSHALEDHAGGPVWVDLPPDTPFWLVRQVLNAADEAEVGAVWISGARGPEAPGPAEAFAISAPPKFALGGSCDAPVAVTGVEPLVTVSIQTGADGAWVLATARLIPVTADGPTDGLDPECLAIPACDVVYPDGPLRAACAAQQLPAPQRVGLGGPLGCLLPIAREPAAAAEWRPDLARLIGTLGLGDRPLRVVMPEAMSRLDAVLAVVGGFVDAGLPPPAIGTQLLVEGNDGPPVCNAPVRDREALAVAGAQWLGGMRAWLAAPPAPDPTPATDGGGAP